MNNPKLFCSKTVLYPFFLRKLGGREGPIYNFVVLQRTKSLFFGLLGVLSLIWGPETIPKPYLHISGSERLQVLHSIMSNIPGYEAALSAATLSLDTARTIKLPWEKPGPMSKIFGTDDYSLKRPRLSLVSSDYGSSSSASTTTAMPSVADREVHLKSAKVRPTTLHLRSVDLRATGSAP